MVERVDNHMSSGEAVADKNRRDRSSGDNSQSDEVSLEKVIQWLVSGESFINESKIQKLVFFAEMLSIRDRKKRLTNAVFKPYMYGAYSKDVKQALENIDGDIEKKADLNQGKVVTSYHSKERPKLPSEIEDVLKETQTLANTFSTEDLGERSKNTWLFQESEYGTNMDFYTYTSLRKNLENDIPSID